VPGVDETMWFRVAAISATITVGSVLWACSAVSHLTDSAHSRQPVGSVRIEQLRNDPAYLAIRTRLGKPIDSGERTECLFPEFDPRPPNVWMRFKRSDGSGVWPRLADVVASAGWRVEFARVEPNKDHVIAFSKSFGGWDSESTAILDSKDLLVSFNAAPAGTCR
jgi:hypothetical protein